MSDVNEKEKEKINREKAFNSIKSNIFHLDPRSSEHETAARTIGLLLKKHAKYNINLRNLIVFCCDEEGKYQAARKDIQDKVNNESLTFAINLAANLTYTNKRIAELEEEIKARKASNSKQGGNSAQHLRNGIQELTRKNLFLQTENEKLKNSVPQSRAASGLTSRRKMRFFLFSLAASFIVGGVSYKIMANKMSPGNVSDLPQSHSTSWQTYFSASKDVKVRDIPNSSSNGGGSVRAKLQAGEPVLVNLKQKNFRDQLPGTWVEVETQSGVSGYVLSKSLLTMQPSRIVSAKPEEIAKDPVSNKAQSVDKVFAKESVLACTDGAVIWSKPGSGGYKMEILEKNKMIYTMAYMESTSQSLTTKTIASLADLKYKAMAENPNSKKAIKIHSYDKEWAKVWASNGSLGYMRLSFLSIDPVGCKRSVSMKRYASAAYHRN